MSKDYKIANLSLDSGLKILLVAEKGLSRIQARSWVFTGSNHEIAANNGISHFLEHMIFRGNRLLGSSADFNRKMEALGGEVNAATGTDLTEFWFDFHQDFFKEGLQQFCRFLRFPLFEDLDVERRIVQGEIEHDYNLANLFIDPVGVQSQMLWPDQALSRPVTGTPASVARLGLDDLQSWFKRYYCPTNMILGLAGDFDFDQAQELIAQEFKTALPGERGAYPTQRIGPIKGDQIRFVPETDNQYQVLWGFPFSGLNPEKRLLLQVLGLLLDDGSASILQRMIREEKGLVYDIEAFNSYWGQGAVLSIQATVGKERLIELIEALCTLIETLKQKGVSQDELEMVKLRYRCGLNYISDSATGMLDALIAPDIYPHATDIPTLLQSLQKLEVATLNAFIKELFDSQQSVFVAIGPQDEKVEQRVRQLIAPWVL